MPFPPPPSGGGAAGGDLSGKYPDPTVAKVPAAAVVPGTRVTVATTAGKAKVSATAPALSHVQSFITAAITVAANVAANITKISLTIGTWLVLATALVTTATSTYGAVEIAVTKVTASMATALVASRDYLHVVATDAIHLTAMNIVTVAAAGTYFLNVESNMAGKVLPAGSFAVTNVFTGIVAIKIA